MNKAKPGDANINAREVFRAYIVGQDPSDSKPNRLHVHIFQFCSIHLRYILAQIPLEWSINLMESWTSTIYFSNSTGSSATNRRFFPDIGQHVTG